MRFPYNAQLREYGRSSELLVNTELSDYVGKHRKIYAANPGGPIVVIGMRHDANVTPQQAQAGVLNNFGYDGYVDDNGTYTRVVDANNTAYGAFLEYKNVVLTGNQGISFCYALIANDYLNNNDCAVILAYDKAGKFVAGEVLYDLMRLDAAGRFVHGGQTRGWRSGGPWRPVAGEPFEGTVRWAMLNAQILDTSDIVRHPPDARLRSDLSCLLLKNIRVKPIALTLPAGGCQ